MKVLLFLAKGFETLEFSPFIDVMGWARTDCHYDVEVTTCGFAKTVISAFKVPVIVDRTFDEIAAKDFDALAIPGGFEEFGFYEEAYDPRFLRLIREFHAQKKVIASICVGALPLGKSGILQNRSATTYHLNHGHRQKQLERFGAKVENSPVVTDGNIVTSYCPQTGPYVAFRLLEMLFPERLDDVSLLKRAMGYDEPNQADSEKDSPAPCVFHNL